MQFIFAEKGYFLITSDQVRFLQAQVGSKYWQLDRHLKWNILSGALSVYKENELIAISLILQQGGGKIYTL